MHFIFYYVNVRIIKIFNYTILITGACMGLGKALAIECAKKKCKLILLDVRSDLSLDLLQDVRREGGEAQFFRCDLSDLQSTKELISTIQSSVVFLFQITIKQKYKVTILINNAGVGIFKLFEDETIQDVIKTNTINYLAPAMLTQEFIKDNINHIVNIGSAASIVQGMKIQFDQQDMFDSYEIQTIRKVLFYQCVTAYSASKHAMWGFHNALRMELKYQNSKVRTTLVCPWGIKTGMIQGLKTKLDYFLPMMSPEYVAQCIVQAIEAGREIIFIQWYCAIVQLNKQYGEFYNINSTLLTYQDQYPVKQQIGLFCLFKQNMCMSLRVDMDDFEFFIDIYNQLRLIQLINSRSKQIIKQIN